MRKLILTLFIALVTFAGVVQAQEVPLFSCFYECKPQQPRIYAAATSLWREVTTLMLVNQNNSYVFADLLFFDGNEKPIAHTATFTLLSPFDLDEINVCETLNLGKISSIPFAGMVQVRLLGVQDNEDQRVTVWIKNLLGSFTKGVTEPFSGTVTGIAKARCDRMMGPYIEGDVQSVFPILIENTDDGEQDD